MRRVAPRTGGRGLKLNVMMVALLVFCRPPHRGAWIEMRYLRKGWTVVSSRPPRRGAWIEIFRLRSKEFYCDVAPRAGGRGLKLPCDKRERALGCRPPRRGAWIEIAGGVPSGIAAESPPAQGGVD